MSSRTMISTIVILCAGMSTACGSPAGGGEPVPPRLNTANERPFPVAPNPPPSPSASPSASAAESPPTTFSAPAASPERFGTAPPPPPPPLPQALPPSPRAMPWVLPNPGRTSIEQQTGVPMSEIENGIADVLRRWCPQHDVCARVVLLPAGAAELEECDSDAIDLPNPLYEHGTITVTGRCEPEASAPPSTPAARDRRRGANR